MAFFDLQMAREQYLEKLLARYGTVTLPIDTARLALPLHTIFQPMILQRDPLAPRDEQPGIASEIVKAKDGAEALTKSKYRRMVVLGGPGMGKTTALKALLSMAITAAQPVLLALEDIHWSDETSLEFLHYLVRHCANQPLMILATYRSDEVQSGLRRWLAQLDRERLNQEITLQPLTRDQIEAMLQQAQADRR